MDSVVKEFETLSKRQRILAQSTINSIDSLLECVSQCRMRGASPTRSDAPRRGSDGDGGGPLKQLVLQTKEQSDRL